MKSKEERNRAAIALYVGGCGTAQIADQLGISPATAWRIINRAGVGRSQSEANKLACEQGRGAAKLKGRKKDMPPEFWERFREAANKAKRAKAKGYRITSQGYIEYTLDDLAGVKEHVVVMERRLGRKLLADEVVHHIDGDKTNNEENNLALVTASGHARLHRREDMLAGIEIPRRMNGQFERRKTTCAQ